MDLLKPRYTTSLVHSTSHLITESNHIGQEKFVPDRSMLAVPSQLLVFHVPEGSLFHYILLN